MTEYSAKIQIFRNVSLSQVTSLLVLLANSTKTDIFYLKRSYQRQSVYFNETLNLLLKIGLVKRVGDNIQENIALKSSELDTKLVAKQLIDALFSKKNFEDLGIRDFLDEFYLQNELYKFYGTNHQRVLTSGLRNFLIELGFLEFNEGQNCYLISKEGLKFLPLNIKKELSPTQLYQRLSDIEKLGRAAELIVMGLEKKRLEKFHDLMQSIEHTAKVYINAGYDIKSFEIGSTLDKATPRYIEVKAVSLYGKKFFWSRNEIEVAKKYGNRYYLYLLPVLGKNKFDTNALTIIANPFLHLIKNKKWKKVEELVSFSETSLD